MADALFMVALAFATINLAVLGGLAVSLRRGERVFEQNRR